MSAYPVFKDMFLYLERRHNQDSSDNKIASSSVSVGGRFWAGVFSGKVTIVNFIIFFCYNTLS